MIRLTKKELGEYIRLGDEIKLLEEKIKELAIEEMTCSMDVVRGSSKHFPYTEHPIKISGFDEENADRVARSVYRKRVRLENIRTIREEEAVRLYDYINSQKDSRTRQVLTYTYIDGKKQKEVAKIMHIDRSLVSLIITNALN